MNISDLITGGIGAQATSAIAKTTGVNESKAKWVIAAAVPLMIAALNYNAKNKGQGEAIDKAAQDHSSGGLMDKLGGLFGGEESNEQGNKIVQHMFGNNTAAVTESVAEKSGLSQNQVGGVLASLAPVVMSYIGQQKKQNGSGGGIGDLIGSVLGGGSTGGIGGLLNGMLGGDSSQEAQPGNQNPTDALGDLAGEFFNKDKGPEDKGNILESIAGMFGK
ncbi:MAG: DUF937 domain-containing protein [Sphingobacterium sp.]|uniref:DUF937 domain-containing protein n=1 Tax=Sphingobacterium sp. JB170 TaxID=1434842 RepID=UPI00097EF8C0|nr:DUF937 domain-containing protein [Sphingobacterium sp. JB170]SJN48326.1 hypothetical protein FM107_16975 [Sphingobacterium sp. JB170]